MTAAADSEEIEEKPSKMGLVIGLVLALMGGGAGFFAAYSGLLAGLLGTGGESHETADSHDGSESTDAHGSAAADIGFVPLESITISLGPRGESRHLRFSAHLEVAPDHAAEVQHLMPRIMDVLNIYLRALDPHELEEPAALLRLRAQMLRRVQIVTGPGYVSDLLVMEFVLN